jgi:ribosomal protein L11 methyltransferase
VLCGSKEAIPDGQFDIILANINRNILLDQIQRYAQALKPGGQLFLSGFYETPDLPIVIEETQKYGLKYACHKNNGDWVAAKVVI